jgi:hypothetical protein
MMKIIRIAALGLASLVAVTGIARAERSHHDLVRPVVDVLDGRHFDPQLLMVQDRPPLDGVIRSLESRYGPGEVRSVSEVRVDNQGREFFTVKYLTEDGQMIIVKVDARSGRIVGGG